MHRSSSSTFSPIRNMSMFFHFNTFVMISDLFMSFFYVLSGHCMFFCVECLFRSFAHIFFTVICLIFELCEFFTKMQALFQIYVLQILSSDLWLAFFSFLAVSLGVQTFLILIKSNLSTFMVYLESLCLHSNLEIFVFSSRSFICLDFPLGLWPTLNLLLCTVVWVRGQG